MTPEQRYLLDLNGYLHLRGVLCPRELSACRASADRHISLCEQVSKGRAASLPEGFGNGATLGNPGGKGYSNGYAFEKPLEQLVFHRHLWPIILELTDGKPGLSTGTMIVDDVSLGPKHQDGSWLHCAREDVERLVSGRPSNMAPFEGACCCEEKGGRIYCDNFVVFPYLDEVSTGDGGLVLLPGSHKSKFNRPFHLFDFLGIGARKQQLELEQAKKHQEGTADLASDFWSSVPSTPPTASASKRVGVHSTIVTNLCPAAGDVIIMPEAT